MRKLLILVLSFSLLISCNNDKGQVKGNDRNTTNRDKDDYRDADDKDRDTKNADDRQEDRSNDRDEDNTSTRSNWSSSDVRQFVNTCVQAAEKGMSKSKAEDYCNCMQQKLEKKYPNKNDVEDLDMESSSMKAMVNQCLGLDGDDESRDTKTSSRGWATKDKDDFVNDCVEEAEKTGASYLDAQSYCDCMQYKLEKAYPDYRDAQRLTKDDLSSSAMKKMMRDCQPGN